MKVDLKKIEAARTAADGLSAHSLSPRKVEANLDILRSALLRLGNLLSKRRKRKANIGLCELLQDFADSRLLSTKAVNCCYELEELIQVSDYDVSDEDEFTENVHAEIEVLQEELERFFASIESQEAAEENSKRA